MLRIDRSVFVNVTLTSDMWRGELRSLETTRVLSDVLYGQRVRLASYLEAAASPSSRSLVISAGVGSSALTVCLTSPDISFSLT